MGGDDDDDDDEYFDAAKKDLLQWVYGRVGSEVLISTGWHAVARGDGVVNPSY